MRDRRSIWRASRSQFRPFILSVVDRGRSGGPECGDNQTESDGGGKTAPNKRASSDLQGLMHIVLLPSP
jgi:hypothetical protein